MSFDGVAEVEATIARLKGALVGGRVHDGLPDDTELERDANGVIKPFIIVLSTTPVGMKTERRLAVSEQSQPFVLPITVTAFADTQSAARNTVGGILRQLVGWQPGGANSTPFETPGGYTATRQDAQKKPTRFEQGVNLLTTINMQTDE
jgi:hypothetical protein